MRRPAATILACCVALVVAVLGCSGAWAGTLRGTASHDGRVALPPDAVFEAALQDVSRADAPAVVVGRVRREPAGQLPIAFEIAYDDAALQPGRRYAVHATIRQGERLLFTTDRFWPVQPGVDSRVDLQLVAVRAGSAPSDSPLRGTYWKLVRLGDMPAQVAEHQREPHLIFAVDQPRAHGSGGCNALAGGFTLDGDKLRLGRFISTMMACPVMDQEGRFLGALALVARYRIAGNRLELLDAAGTVLARFDAVALP
jgi:putative lipoprotein